MKNYYDLLGIEKTADQMQIKRAYFGLVRKYPPERFPEEFKELRAAYETLSDEQKRAEYDQIGAIPEAVADIFHHAQKANRTGHHADASDMYRLILKRNPELAKVREEYAHSLEAEGKSGKAVEAWEALCKQEPANPAYAVELAHSYVDRGWRNKAIAQYWRGLELDKSNADCWTSLVNCHGEAGEWDKAKEITAQALEAVKEKNSGNILLYGYAFMLFNDKEEDNAEDYLQNIIRLMRTEQKKNMRHMAETVSIIMDKVYHLRMVRMFPYVQEMVNLLSDKDKKLLEQFERLKLVIDIESLAEKGFSDLFYDLFNLLHEGIDSRDKRNDLLAMEWTILSEINTYRPQLLRLEKEYPQLYALHEVFFNEALSAKNPEKMKYQREKALAKQKLLPLGLMDDAEKDWDDEVQTIRREGPKIGRNDPCPCGSGKKYKKCCGA
jgi:pentatricopeptide repeat protein